jgi:NAD(P)-dependent dehydrogenase (short-subunit alcohol dehydrogenase family)
MIKKRDRMSQETARRAVLLVGAAGGVGAEVADQLQGRFDLICTVRNADQEAILRDRISGVSQVVNLDLSDNHAIRHMLATLLTDSSVDLAAVIVCAATCPTGPLELATADALASTLQVNAVSHLAIYQGCIAALRRSQGRLIFVGSYSGKIGMPFTGLYAASKFALEGLVDVMRREVGKWGVSVILIQPGGIKTAMALKQLREIPQALSALSGEQKELYGGLYERFVRLVDMSYPVSSAPADVAKVIVSALMARRPKTRYSVGADARRLLALSRRLSDRGLDAVCDEIFESVSRAESRSA